MQLECQAVVRKKDRERLLLESLLRCLRCQTRLQRRTRQSAAWSKWCRLVALWNTQAALLLQARRDASERAERAEREAREEREARDAGERREELRLEGERRGRQEREERQSRQLAKAASRKAEERVAAQALAAHKDSVASAWSALRVLLVRRFAAVVAREKAQVKQKWRIWCQEVEVEARKQKQREIEARAAEAEAVEVAELRRRLREAKQRMAVRMMMMTTGF